MPVAGHCPLAPPVLLSALLFGCGWLTSPDVPAVPALECERAVDELDVAVDFRVELPALFDEAVCFVEPFRCDVVDFWDFGAACAVAVCLPLLLPLLLPGSATAEPPLSEMIIRSSAAITDVVVLSARARSLHGRTMEIPTNPPGPHRGPDIENPGHHEVVPPKNSLPAVSFPERSSGQTRHG